MSEQAGTKPVRVGEQSIDAEHDLQMVTEFTRIL